MFSKIHNNPGRRPAGTLRTDTSSPDRWTGKRISRRSLLVDLRIANIHPMDLSDFALRIGAALLSGLMIGFERQWQHKAAGLRTNTLVAVGSALYTLLSISLTREQGDVTRIIGQVVTGIGFLCAGVIFKEGFSLHGLTTAAVIWCNSAIGCLAAAGMFAETALATATIIGVNLLLKPVDGWLADRDGKDHKHHKDGPLP